MDFILAQDTKMLMLPVPPGEFTVSTGNNNKTFNIHALGEISLIGKSKLSTITFSSIFPAQDYPFCPSNILKPYQYVKLIEAMKQSGKPIRLIITDTNINNYFTIESFEYGEKDGSGDVAYTITLKEYRHILVTTKLVTSTAKAVPRKKTYTTKNSSKPKYKVNNRKVTRAKTKKSTTTKISTSQYYNWKMLKG